MTYRSSKSVNFCALGASRRIKQKKLKKVYLRNHNTCFFTCSPRPPTLSQRHMDLHVWSYQRPGYIFQVSSNPFRGFGAPRGQNLAFPITLASRFYNRVRVRVTVQAVMCVCMCNYSSQTTEPICIKNIPANKASVAT